MSGARAGDRPMAVQVLLLALAAGLGASAAHGRQSAPPEEGAASQAEPPAPESSRSRRRRPAEQPPEPAAPASSEQGDEDGDASPDDAGAAEPAGAEPMPSAVPIDPRMPTDTLGFAGDSPYRLGGPMHVVPRPTVALPDRWRIGWPSWDRYARQAPHDPFITNVTGGDSPYTLGNPVNPYDRNVLKGDYPVIGDDVFLNLTAVSDLFVQYRDLPTPSGVSASGAGSFDFFGDGKQFFLRETALLSFDLFRGSTAFRPVDWLIRVSPAFDVNYLELREDNGVNIDVRKGDSRGDDHFFLNETFVEWHLGDTSPYFDFISMKAGRQLFVSDFRGFIFNDLSDGVRLFGNAEANRIQWNAAFFWQPEKDTNSELPELDWRDQQVVVGNVYVQDFIWEGYTTQFSLHYMRDRSDQRYDSNGFLARPSLAGSVTLQDIDAVYLGWAGDGHIGRLNVNHAFYWVGGEDGSNPIAGRSVDISAFLAAIELSVDMDWLRPKVSFLYASGDDDPLDGTGGGFDGIVDNPFFAGGSSSFYQSQALRIFGVNLTSGRSFYNDLAGGKAEGQSNYVNPGSIVANAGFDAELTPQLRASFNANAIFLAQTQTMELFLNQNDINRHLGVETNLFLQWRPLLTNNIIMSAGGSLFFPGEGFGDIYGDEDMLWQGFVGLTLVY